MSVLSIMRVTILALVMSIDTAIGGESKKQIINWTPDGRNSAQKVTLTYWTSMDAYGTLSATFETVITNFNKEQDDRNVRICLALKENDIGEREWDIGQVSMRKFKDLKWSAKDGMHGDCRDWCGKEWNREGEKDVDWVVEPLKLPYDANKRTITTRFKRKLVGSTERDYTYKLNTPYEYRIMFGVWNDERHNDKGRSKESPDKTDNKKNLITFLTATYD